MPRLGAGRRVRFRSFRELGVSLEHTIHWDPEPWSVGELPGCLSDAVGHSRGRCSLGSPRSPLEAAEGARVAMGTPSRSLLALGASCQGLLLKMLFGACHLSLPLEIQHIVGWWPAKGDIHPGFVQTQCRPDSWRILQAPPLRMTLLCHLRFQDEIYVL